MIEYWLDTNIFIESKNGPYPFDLVPGFWTLLETKAVEGIIAIPSIVYDEMADQHDDDLSDWLKDHQANICVAPDAQVQTNFTKVADHVNRAYDIAIAAGFLSKADAWLVAYAMTHGGSVVTFETRVNSTSKKAKIPNICDYFGIRCVDRTVLLRALGASFR